MKIEVFEYNSFCSDSFLGNPAGVCMDEGLSKEEKQKIAYKNGFSETAFLLEEDSYFKISFFTPTSEIDLCGHATVASAAHLSNKMGIKKITFRANHDVLYCDVDNEFVSLILPDQKIIKKAPNPVIKEILGTSCIDYYESKIHFIGVLDSFDNLMKWDNDFYSNYSLSKDQLILTSPFENSNYDYALRMFGTKNLGVREDPVTGSAQPPIFSYWSKILKKEDVLVYQSSERGGLMRVKRDLRGIDVNGRVKLVKHFNQEI